MLKFIIGILICLSIILTFIIYLIRYYDFREVFFWILSKKHNIKNIIYWKELNYNNINQINNILQLETKGFFIENLIAQPAWKPIISLESVDYQEWGIVKKNFLHFTNLTNLNSKINNLGEYLNFFVSKYLSDNNNIIIDSQLISKITVSTFCKFLFETVPEQSELDILFNASIEWRKEIAIKGKGNMDTKLKAITIILNYIKSNHSIYMIFGDDWNKPEYYSVILQPFIISPMINISDIMANVQILLTNRLINSYEPITNEFINKIIFSSHPFPVLERFDEKTLTQHFIPLDQLAKFTNYSDIYKNLVFGTGKRKCAGQHYAYVILKRFIYLYFQNTNKFNPTLNHKYSGRNNDNFNLNESIYMAKILLKLLIQ